MAESEYYKIWLKKKNCRKVMTYYVRDKESASPVQCLFDKLPINVLVKKYQKINETQFERLINSKYKYKSLEDVLSEGIYC